MLRGIRGTHLFDGREVVEGAPVVVIDEVHGTIVSVGEEPPPTVDTTDLGDVTLLPGLIDAHQHLCFDGNGSLQEQVEDRTDDELRARARANARRALAAGITTIRDLGDRGYVTLGLRDDPDLPTILAAGPPITVDGGHCWFLGGECQPSSAEEIVAAVRERHARGCDVVKIMVTGGALTPTFPMWRSQFSGGEVRAAVEAAHELGLPVAAHCHGGAGIADAVDAGVDTIEHCTFMSEDDSSRPDADVLARMAASGIAVSATLGRLPDAPVPPRLAANLPIMAEAFRLFALAGGHLVAGTDAGISPGKPHDVLPLAVTDLRLIGMSDAQALRALTAVAATVIGLGQRKGRLLAGFDADVLAVAGDAITDAEALLDVRGVWRAGRQVAGVDAVGV